MTPINKINRITFLNTAQQRLQAHEVHFQPTLLPVNCQLNFFLSLELNPLLFILYFLYLLL